MNAHDILIKPVVTEKTTALMEEQKYVFRVPMKANRTMVKQAVKEIFGVQPEKVNMMVVRGKTKRVRYQFGNRPAWKKAVVTLKAGDKIEIFDA